MQPGRVYLIRRKNYRNWYMIYTDQHGTRHTRSTRTHKRAEAERAAAEWAREIGTRGSGCQWDQFREDYRNLHLSGLRQRSRQNPETTLDQFEKVAKPDSLPVDPRSVGVFAAWMRKKGMSEATITGRIGSLRAALRWADSQGYGEAPKMPRVKRTDSSSMKGRPLSDAEFKRLKAHIPDRTNQAEWEFLADGLWLSGLRLGEALKLSWDDPEKIMVDFTGRFPMFRIPGEVDKSGRTRLLPITPDFAEFLKKVETKEGDVFSVARHRIWYVSSTFVDAGRRAKIKVGGDKTASAHDLRRSFGARWAMKVTPQVLMSLMRHSDISTTMRYYVGINAERIAEELEGFA